MELIKNKKIQENIEKPPEIKKIDKNSSLVPILKSTVTKSLLEINHPVLHNLYNELNELAVQESREKTNSKIQIIRLQMVIIRDKVNKYRKDNGLNRNDKENWRL